MEFLAEVESVNTSSTIRRNVTGFWAILKKIAHKSVVGWRIFVCLFVCCIQDGGPIGLKNSPPSPSVGSFSNDNGDGSENITIKMISCFLKCHRDYSNSL